MIKKFFFICTIIYFIFPLVTVAHPGNTDSSGGHTCRTNCDDWGLNYGEYHYHNSGIYDYSDSLDDYDEGYDEGYDFAYGYTSECEKDYGWEWEGTQDYGDGFEDGIDDGHWDGLEVCYDDSYAVGMEVGENESYEGLEYNENREIEDWYDTGSYLKGYAEGYDEEAYEDAMADENESELVKSTLTSSQDPSSDFSTSENDNKTQIASIVTIAGVIGLVALRVGQNHYKLRKKKKDKL